MKLGLKFVIVFVAFVLISNLVVIGTALVQSNSMINTSSEEGSKALSESAGISMQSIATEITEAHDNYLKEKYKQVEMWAMSPIIVQTCKDAKSYSLSQLYDMWSDPATREFDSGEAVGDGDPTNDLNPEASLYLMALVDKETDEDGHVLFPEIFFTDSRGYAIGASVATGDFDQGPDDWRLLRATNGSTSYEKVGPAPGGEEWYKAANTAPDGLYVSEIMFDESSAMWGLEICVVIRNPDTGQRVGTLKAFLDYSHMIEENLDISDIGADELKVLSSSGILVAYKSSSDSSYSSTSIEYEVNTDHSDLDSYIAASAQQDTGYLFEEEDDGDELLSGYALSSDDGGHVIIVSVDANKVRQPAHDLSDQISDLGRSLIIFIIIVGVVSAIIAVIVAFLFARSITATITKLVKVSKSMAEGDFDVSVDIDAGNDEIGDMVKSYRNMLDNTALPLREMNTAAKGIADGDLTQKINIKAKGEINEIVESFKKMQDNLKSLVGEIQETSSSVASTSQEVASSAEEMNASIEQVSSAIQQISRGSQNQASQVEETAMVMKEMSMSVEDVAKRTETAADAARLTSKSAASGQKIMVEAVTKMEQIQHVVGESAGTIESLGTRSEEIGQIVDVITNITDQTNMLALNAAIEAARAGEQGRGFAVVAEEVKNLAEDSREAADRIAKMVKEIQKETSYAVEAMKKGMREVEEGTKLLKETDKAFSEIADVSANASAQVDLISAATQQQLAGTDKVVKSIDNIASVAEEAASASEESASSTEELTASMEDMTARAQEMSEMAIALQRNAERFKLDRDGAFSHSRTPQKRPPPPKKVHNVKTEPSIPKKVQMALSRRGISVPNPN